MNSGMYSALSGNLSAMMRMEVISNNLANINTLGYKRDKISFESVLAGSMNPPAVPQSTTADPITVTERVSIDYAAGMMSRTGNSLDMAIDGDGFFTVSGPDGPAYTRQGNFRLNADGTLVTVDGLPVIGQGGEIRIRGSQIEIGAKGDIVVDGTKVDTLKIVDFPKPYNLNKIGSALFVPADPQTTPQAVPQNTMVRHEHLEASNVDPISEMVQLIDVSRYFDSCQRVILGFDGMANKAANELGKI